MILGSPESCPDLKYFHSTVMPGAFPPWTGITAERLLSISAAGEDA